MLYRRPNARQHNKVQVLSYLQEPWSATNCGTYADQSARNDCIFSHQHSTSNSILTSLPTNLPSPLLTLLSPSHISSFSRPVMLCSVPTTPLRRRTRHFSTSRRAVAQARASGMPAHVRCGMFGAINGRRRRARRACPVSK